MIKLNNNKDDHPSLKQQLILNQSALQHVNQNVLRRNSCSSFVSHHPERLTPTANHTPCLPLTPV